MCIDTYLYVVFNAFKIQLCLFSSVTYAKFKDSIDEVHDCSAARACETSLHFHLYCNRDPHNLKIIEKIDFRKKIIASTSNSMEKYQRFSAVCSLYKVCRHVCMYVCIYLSIYLSIYLCIYVSMYLYIYVSMYVMLSCVMLSCDMLCYVMLCYVMLCYVMLCMYACMYVCVLCVCMSIYIS